MVVLAGTRVTIVIIQWEDMKSAQKIQEIIVIDNSLGKKWIKKQTQTLGLTLLLSLSLQ